MFWTSASANHSRNSTTEHVEQSLSFNTETELGKWQTRLWVLSAFVYPMRIVVLVVIVEETLEMVSFPLGEPPM